MVGGFALQIRRKEMLHVIVRLQRPSTLSELTVIKVVDISQGQFEDVEQWAEDEYVGWDIVSMDYCIDEDHYENN